MKKAICVLVLVMVSMISFGQVKKTDAKDSLVRVKDSVTKMDIPAGVTVFVLNPEQVALLEEVIGQSNASFQKTNVLIQILKTQQYSQPAKKSEQTAGGKKEKDKSN